MTDRTPARRSIATQTLIDAINKGTLEDVGRLIDEGAEVNGENAYGLTPLYFAILEAKIDVAELLLERGADVNRPAHRSGRRPLYFAADAGHEEIVEALLHAGAAINAVDQYGGTALGACVGSLSNLILNLPDPVRWCDEQDSRPTGHVAVAEALINRGADVNLAPKGHYTPAALIRRRPIRRLVALLKGREKRGWF